MAGEDQKLSRSENSIVSWASVPAHGNTQRSRATPAASAAAAEQRISAAAWSRSQLEFMALV